MHRAPASLPLPLDEGWRRSIEVVARAHKWPTAAEPAQLGALVRALSEAYNAPLSVPGRAVAASAPALAARLGFSFARDVPKAQSAVRELVAWGGLAARGESTLRVLDAGAGLGASTWGIARALSAAGWRGALEATWTDEDAHALDVALELVHAREGREDGVVLRVAAERRRASVDMVPGEPFDLVLVGQVLSEMDAAAAPEERVLRHAALLSGLVARLRPSGALVVVEPALCERTRHLHAVRDAVLAARAASVFAPCLHAAPCPALEAPGDWCHEDLAIDLPEWLAPVARAAGLRWQGLTFSYLVLRRAAEPTLAERLPRGGVRARVVSGALVSKGKRECFLCGELGGGEGGEVGRARVSRLDRDESESNAAWGSLARGDLVALDPAAEPKKRRIGAGHAVTVLTEGAPAGALDPPPRRGVAEG